MSGWLVLWMVLSTLSFFGLMLYAILQKTKRRIEAMPDYDFPQDEESSVQELTKLTEELGGYDRELRSNSRKPTLH
jgi:hypothetical protein